MKPKNVPKTHCRSLYKWRDQCRERTIRLNTETDERIQSAAKLRGYSSPSSFLRGAIQKELGEREDGMIGTEERLAASIEQVRRNLFRLVRTQQALFAFVDNLAKVLFDMSS